MRLYKYKRVEYNSDYQIAFQHKSPLNNNNILEITYKRPE
jgi:hypothetical protein